MALDVVALKDDVIVFGNHVRRGKGFCADIVESQLAAVRAMEAAGDIKVYGPVASRLVALASAEAEKTSIPQRSK